MVNNNQVFSVWTHKYMRYGPATAAPLLQRYRFVCLLFWWHFGLLLCYEDGNPHIIQTLLNYVIWAYRFFVFIDPWALPSGHFHHKTTPAKLWHSQTLPIFCLHCVCAGKQTGHWGRKKERKIVSGFLHVYKRRQDTLGGDVYSISLVMCPQTCSDSHISKRSSRKQTSIHTPLPALTYKHEDTHSKRHVYLVELSDSCLKWNSCSCMRDTCSLCVWCTLAKT